MGGWTVAGSYSMGALSWWSVWMTCPTYARLTVRHTRVSRPRFVPALCRTRCQKVSTRKLLPRGCSLGFRHHAGLGVGS